MITIKVLSTQGDNIFQFTEVAEAQPKVLELRAAGHTLFSIDPETKETTLVNELFPDAQVIAIPQISGG